MRGDFFHSNILHWYGNLFSIKSHFSSITYKLDVVIKFELIVLKKNLSVSFTSYNKNIKI